MSFFENARKPTSLGGGLMVSLMNLGHSALANWGLHFLDLPKDAKIPDCGCDGMKIYKDSELKVVLESTGFGDIQTHKNQKGWQCSTAIKK